jgi:hypothetical protein
VLDAVVDRHAVIEQVITDLKGGSGLAHLPSASSPPARPDRPRTGSPTTSAAGVPSWSCWQARNGASFGFGHHQRRKDHAMAMAFELRFAGGTTDQYDQVIQKMGLSKEGTGPTGALFHWVAATDEGLLVVDVWKSQEIFDRFAGEQIMPYTQEVGLPRPDIRAYQVHNYLVGQDLKGSA